MTDFMQVFNARKYRILRTLLQQAKIGPVTENLFIPDGLYIRIHAAAQRLRKAPLTQRQTIAAVRALGLTCVCTDGEYRVDRKPCNEATAYYTDDAEDALGTAIIMRYGADAVICALRYRDAWRTA